MKAADDEKDSTYLDIFENSPIIWVSHNIIHCIWGQPDIHFGIEVAERTSWYTDLPRITWDSKHINFFITQSTLLLLSIERQQTGQYDMQFL